MVATIQGYPFATTVGNNGLFNVSANGLTQGTAYPDPSTRWALRQGILAQAETAPMFGGVGVYADVPTKLSSTSASSTLGTTVGRATTLTAAQAGTLAGFSVFDQDYSMVNFPGNAVPIVGSGGSVMWYPLGSRARIAVACSPNLVNLRGEAISTQVSWDFANEQLEPYVSTTLASLNSYTSLTGVVSIATTAAHGLLPGDTFEISSVTGTGADLATLNGEHTAITGTTGSTLIFTVATGLTISSVTGGTLSSGGILPVSVLDVQVSNSMTVTLAGGLYNWNFTGNAAIIQI